MPEAVVITGIGPVLLIAWAVVLIGAVWVLVKGLDNRKR